MMHWVSTRNQALAVHQGPCPGSNSGESPLFQWQKREIPSLGFSLFFFIQRKEVKIHHFVAQEKQDAMSF